MHHSLNLLYLNITIMAIVSLPMALFYQLPMAIFYQLRKYLNIKIWNLMWCPKYDRVAIKQTVPLESKGVENTIISSPLFNLGDKIPGLGMDFSTSVCFYLTWSLGSVARDIRRGFGSKGEDLVEAVHWFLLCSLTNSYASCACPSFCTWDPEGYFWLIHTMNHSLTPWAMFPELWGWYTRKCTGKMVAMELRGAVGHWWNSFLCIGCRNLTIFLILNAMSIKCYIYIKG